MAMKPLSKVHFDLLDGMRGVAAIFVMLYHFSYGHEQHLLAGAWVSVDLFFVLSGVVITQAYKTKILAGMSLREFGLVRIKRLGFVYLVGLFLAALATSLTHTPAWTLTKQMALAAFTLPYFETAPWPFGDSAGTGPVFLLNLPRWSIFFELFANLLFFSALRLQKRTPSFGVCVLAVLAFWLSVILMRKINPGPNLDNFVLGFARVTTEFFLGSILFSEGYHNAKPRRILACLVTSQAFVLMFFRRNVVAILDAAIIVPCSIALLSAVRITGSLRLVCARIGSLSYPLYMIHFPLRDLVYGYTSIGRLPFAIEIATMSVISIFAAELLSRVESRINRRIRFGAWMRIPSTPDQNRTTDG